MSMLRQWIERQNLPDSEQEIEMIWFHVKRYLWDSVDGGLKEKMANDETD